MYKFFLLLILPVSLFSQILEANLHTSWSIYDVQNIYAINGLPPYVGEINYSVDGYQFKYLTTDANGNSVQASGAVFFPVDATCPLPMLSWQHGTMVLDSGAPSEDIENQYIGIISASHGYIVVMSDYLGLGSGEGFHNYCHSDTEASAVIDLILLSKEYASSIQIETNNQLFLMGYSQGGHATMATVKEIEQNWSENLSVTASCPMAGPYSMSEVQLNMINSIYPNPGYFPYVIFSYQNAYGNIYNNVSDILKPGFSDLLGMYNGQYTMGEINEEIWSIALKNYDLGQDVFTPLDMLQENYYYEFQNNVNHPFRLALAANDLIDFTPNSPMRLIHCSGDNDVDFQNSVIAFESFQNEATEELLLLDGGNIPHSDCALMSIITAKLFFDSKVNLCNSDFEVNELLDSNNDVAYMFDIFGRNTLEAACNKLLIKIYEDGSVEKIINIRSTH